MKKNNKNIIISISLVLIAIVYTLLIKLVDVKGIGPKGSKVGFSTINNLFAKKIGVNMSLYKLTEILGYMAFLLVLVYAVIGIRQLIKRKSSLKVDKEIIVTGFFYIFVLGMYALFEILKINYRPTLIDNILEVSYPSSHTMLAVCLCSSTIILNKLKYSKIRFFKIENIISIILMILIVFGRLFSGVHWFTDILGGIIISSGMLFIYCTILNMVKER